MAATPQRQLYIGGAWVVPARGQYLDTVNPATEQPFGRIPAATAEDVEAAVMAATAAHKSGHWSKTTGAYRAQLLRAIAQKVRAVLLWATCSSGRTTMHHLDEDCSGWRSSRLVP